MSDRTHARLTWAALLAAIALFAAANGAQLTDTDAEAANQANLRDAIAQERHAHHECAGRHPTATAPQDQP